MASVSTNNKQYSLGTVAVTADSPTVVGTATLWSGQVSACQWFSIAGEGILYTIEAVAADGKSLTLATPYLGKTAAKANYLVQRNFTANVGYPIPAHGDQDTGTLLGYALTAIDLALAQITPKLSAIVNGDVQVTGHLEIDGSSLDAGVLSTQGAFMTVASTNTGTTTYAGLEVQRGGTNAFLAWNEKTDRWGSYTSADSMTTPALADMEVKTLYGAVANPSDRRLKRITGPVQDALAKLCTLDVVRFVWNERAHVLGRTGPDVGLLAQQVEAVLPEAVVTQHTGERFKYVAYEKLVSVLVGALQEVNERLEAAEAKMAKISLA